MKRIIARTEAAISAVSSVACIAGGWILIALSLAICVEVVLRKVFSLSLQGIDEYGGYSLAVTSALGMAYCFYDHAHIRIDLVVRRLPRRLFWVSSLLAVATLGATAWYFASSAWSVVFESWDFGAFANTPLRTPLVIPQGAWATGLSIFLAAIIVRLLRIIVAVATRDEETLTEILGEEPNEADGPVEGASGAQ